MIYFAWDRANEAIKVGLAADPAGRLAEGQTWNPTPLVLLFSMHGGRRSELAIHERFKSFRIRGEWFHDEALSAARREATRLAPRAPNGLPERMPKPGDAWFAWWGFGDSEVVKQVVIKEPVGDGWATCDEGRTVCCYVPADPRPWQEQSAVCCAYELCFPVGFPFETSGCTSTRTLGRPGPRRAGSSTDRT